MIMKNNLFKYLPQAGSISLETFGLIDGYFIAARLYFEECFVKSLFGFKNLE